MGSVAEKFGLSAEQIAAADRKFARDRQIERVLSPLKRIPVIGHYIWSFWYLILTEGIRETCTPRWGAITFAFLNDGMKPTVWHTWRQITTADHANSPYCGIYPEGAPRSLAEAIAFEEAHRG